MVKYAIMSFSFKNARIALSISAASAYLIVRVASIPGLMILKLVAWSDRGRETDKDAADIYRLLSTYADAGNTDRLYENEMDLLEAVGFDLQLAGAELLGRDVGYLCAPKAITLIRSLQRICHL